MGAGIVGASIAYHLARRGAAVTLVDKHQPGGGATSASFASINVAHGLPDPYRRLRHLAIDEYRRLERELNGALRIDWCGSMTWRREPAETERFVCDLAAWGYDIRLIGCGEIAALEPNLVRPPDCAAYAAGEAAIEPVAATATLIDAARRAGADVRPGVEVLALIAQARSLTGVRTSAGAIDADVVVLAAGTGSAGLCGPLGMALPVTSSPAWLLRFRVPGRLVNRVISSPDLEIRQSAGDRLLAAEDYDGTSPAEAQIVARRTLASIRHFLRGAGSVEVEDATLGMRPMPADGLPIVGFSSQVDGLYVAVMHAGVTLAPWSAAWQPRRFSRAPARTRSTVAASNG